MKAKQCWQASSEGKVNISGPKKVGAGGGAGCKQKATKQPGNTGGSKINEYLLVYREEGRDRSQR